MKVRIWFKFQGMDPVMATTGMAEEDLVKALNFHETDRFIQIGNRIIEKNIIAHLEVISLS